MEIVLLVIRLILFGVFAVSGVTKLIDGEGTEKALRDFGMPAEFTRFFALALPLAEIVFAVSLLFVSMSWVGAAGALLLLATFTGGMAWQMWQGRAPDCHCFGQIHSEPVSAKSVVRNLIFAGLAVLLLSQGREKQGLELAETGSGMLQMVLILFLFVLGVVLLGYLVKLMARQNELARRLDVLELAPGAPGPVERNEAGDPADGLPIGAPLPDFAIPDLNGRIVQFDHLLGASGGRPFLFLFVGAHCGPCDLLLPEMREWEKALAEKLQIVFVTHGEIDLNRQKFAGGPSPVLVEPNREFAASVNAKWTPTALFVDAGGNIGSHLAAGDVAIRRLVEQIKQRDLNKEFTYFLGLTGRRRPNIGQRIPQFSATDVNGRPLTDGNFAGRRTLVAFTSPTCGHCSELITQIHEWETENNGTGPQIVIFTDGDEEAERGHGLRSPIIVDKGYRTASKFGMRGVPSAVLVNEDRIIATEAAIGPPQIWSLIGKSPTSVSRSRKN
jgi:thiol-disulfide isomerase/thioredoxin/uncharacterized membrane protein YphA (DoxX/SURF4 family)